MKQEPCYSSALAVCAMAFALGWQEQALALFKRDFSLQDKLLTIFTSLVTCGMLDKQLQSGIKDTVLYDMCLIFSGKMFLLLAQPKSKGRKQLDKGEARNCIAKVQPLCKVSR